MGQPVRLAKKEAMNRLGKRGVASFFIIRKTANRKVAIWMTDASLNAYVQGLVTAYSAHADNEYAEWSKNYLRNQFKFLGIRAPIRRKLTNQFIKENGLPPKEKLRDVIFMLWDLPEREFEPPTTKVAGFYGPFGQ
ncbi:DNA alkylation repair enzyme [Bacillus thermotolerans]|uniref:DNA alkylation repair enzyme n=2 Tax=Bacillus thermotolerans TaxID=1221996 RepID=A0A0F5HR02_BACTR|nr:DNA alkylation repair enzyme [Bacillus thermotolerans]KKB35789.1 DNA alkylation repair enzyme [Bacillus thermotolerans]